MATEGETKCWNSCLRGGAASMLRHKDPTNPSSYFSYKRKGTDAHLIDLQDARASGVHAHHRHTGRAGDPLDIVRREIE